MKVSVITPNIRKGGLEIVHNSLLRQTHKDWEWLICSPFNPEIKEAIWLIDDYKGGFWSLNRAYNKLLANVSSELVISWQDWIFVNPHGLESFINAYKETGGIISGVGDQYESVDKFGRPSVKIWADPRKRDGKSFYEIYPNDAEFNWCAFPTKAAFDVGGFDEQLDFLGYGGDQLQFCTRLDELGYKFYLDQRNESFTVRHGREDFGGQEAWDSKHVLFNGKYDARIVELKMNGTWPKLDFLKKE